MPASPVTSWRPACNWRRATRSISRASRKRRWSCTASAGRDHNKNAFSAWLAGAGVRGGTTYGATDEFGLAAVEKRVSVPDWHATILHLLGLNHEELFWNQHGLKERLTGVVKARVVKEI